MKYAPKIGTERPDNPRDRLPEITTRHPAMMTAGFDAADVPQGDIMNTSFNKRMCLLVLAATGGFALDAFPDDAPRGTPTRPEYNQKGELLAPRGFRTWVFAGADESPTYKGDLPESTRPERPQHDEAKAGSFHNIYINPEAYRAFLETGKFPDPTVLVMEVFRAERKDSKGVLKGGEFEGKRIGFRSRGQG